MVVPPPRRAEGDPVYALTVAVVLVAVLVSGVVGVFGTPAATRLAVAATPAASPIAASAEETIEFIGLVTHPGPISVSELQTLPTETVEVTYESGGSPEAHTFTGVRLTDVLEHVGVAGDPATHNPLLRRYLIVTAKDGYQIVVSGGELDPNFGNAPMLLAWEQDGAPLSAEDGPRAARRSGGSARWSLHLRHRQHRRAHHRRGGILSTPAVQPLVIYAPGSLIPVQGVLRKGFREVAPEVDLIFHPPTHSGLLAQQILAGGAADVFISAGWRYIVELHEAGLLPNPQVIAGNRLALLVRSDLAAEIGGVQDLARPGLRMLVPPEASGPLGQYTAELFAIAGLTETISEKRRSGEISEDVGGLGDTLASNGVDAVAIYASMLEAFSAAGTAVPLSAPYDLNDRIVFGAGAIVRDGQAHPAATRFVDFLIGSQGQTLLTEEGFLPRSHVPHR